MTSSYTFYSYKGGSGRTTVLLNTVRHLIKDLGASPERPILLVDADLESAGLTFYFDKEDKFKGQLNTNNVFERIGDIFSGTDEDIIFGETVNELPIHRCSSSSAARKLGELDELDIETPKISQVFSDIELPAKYFSLFKKVLDPVIDGAKDAKKYGQDERMRKIIRPIFRLKDKMVELQSLDLPSDEIAKKKAELLVDFLPTRSFVDVSEYFSGDNELAPGTVRFLGTDTGNDSRVSRNDAVSCTNTLIEKCEEHGYAAVLFDSGSGTQSSAYMLHHVSDVIVYCLRPTIQFIKGTKDNLFRFEDILDLNLENNQRDGKVVILFPNAVPNTSGDEPFSADAFDKIQSIASRFRVYVDDTFCRYESSLHEVPLFKWHEKILGCKDHHTENMNEKLVAEIDRYSHDTIPEDAKGADETYALLSRRLIDNSK